MDIREYLKSEATEIKHCTAREVCPIGSLCSTQAEGSEKPLYPIISSFEKNELFWTNMRYENRVYIVKSGVLACVAHVKDREIPFALFGRGIAIGLGELYAPSRISDDYHMRPLVPGKLCSVSLKALRKRLEQMPKEYGMRLVCCDLTNQSASSFSQMKIVTRKATYERIVELLFCLRDLTKRGGAEQSTFDLTHEEVALIISSDRVSVTRALRKMKEEGAISLGYKSITAHFDKMDRNDFKVDEHPTFISTGITAHATC